MAVESILQKLIASTGQSGNSAAQVYARWAGLTEKGSLTQLVNAKLTANGKSSQIKGSLLQTVRAGGATGNSLAQTLLQTGLTGWS